jgi:Tol biopolymer transport system component
VALGIAAMLLLALFAGTVLTAGQRGFTGLVIAPAPPVSPVASVKAVFPLTNPTYDLVVIDDANHLFTIRTDGTGRTPAAEDITGTLASPEWGPGLTVLVQESEATSDQIWQVDPSAARRSQVIVPCVTPCGSRNEASWSHDGTKIALFQAFGGPVNGIPVTCGLGLYDAPTLAVTDVTSSPCAIIEERNPRFSPDDRSIAFWRSRSPGRVPVQAIEDSAIFVRDLETGVETQVTPWTAHASMLDWSPDGQWIAFVPDVWDPAAADAEVWRARSDGTALDRMTNLDDASSRILRPRYTPDGAWILFMQTAEGRGELLAVPASGGEPVSVLPGTRVFDFDVRAAD